MKPCEHCSRLTGGVICWRCAALLCRQLDELPWYLEQLHEAAYGGAKLARTQARTQGDDSTTHVKFNERAAGLLMRCNAQLARWWHTGGAVQPSGVLRARHLANSPTALVDHPRAGEMLAALPDMLRECEEAIDLPASRRLIGLCIGCSSALYAVDDDPKATCSMCGLAMEVETVRAHGVAQVSDEPRPAADLWRLAQWTGVKLSRATFYRIIGSVEPCAYSMKDFGALYRWADVEDTLRQRARELVFGRAWREAHAENERRAMLTCQHA